MVAMTASKTVADQLRALIEAELKKGTSLREIARRADLSPSLIVKLSQGSSIKIESAEALAKALGKPIRLG